MTAPQEPLKLTLDAAILELTVRFWRLERSIDGRWWVSNDERTDGDDFSILERTGFTTWPEAVAAALGRPVVARDDAAELRAAISDAAAFLKRIDDWEGSVILSDEVWATSDGMPKLTRELYDQWIELQDERNRARAALAATEGSES